jgi:predicted DNA-binding transcriptional regulator YafY
MRDELGDGAKRASRSTAERSKRAIEAVFPQLHCVNPDEPGEKRWRIPAGALDGLVGFGADDLAAVLASADLCERHGLVPQAAVLRDLDVRLRAGLGRAAATVAPDLEALTEAEGIAHRPGPRPKSDSAVLNALRHAIKSMRRVEITYRGRQSNSLSRQRVSPLGILYGSRNYLLAYNHNRAVGAIRSFALPNIQAVRLLDAPAYRPPQFTDLKSYTAHWFGVFEEPATDVVLRFSRRSATDARDYLFHPSQTVHELPRGRVEIRFRAGGLREMAWQLVSWGRDVEVVEPKRLGRMLVVRDLL